MNSPPPPKDSTSGPKPDPSDPLDYDPVYLQSFRELGVIIALFLVFFVWSVGTCYWLGYTRPDVVDAPVAMIWGMPNWVFWGILLPWVGVDVAAVWFCFFYMKDDDLGESHEGEDLVQQVLKKQHRDMTWRDQDESHSGGTRN